MVYGIVSFARYGTKTTMNNGLRHRPYSTLGRATAAGLLLAVLLLDYVLTLYASGPGMIRPLNPSFSSDAPLSIRTEAERAGNLAVVHSGEGSGIQLQNRSGRTNLSPVQRLQENTAVSGPLEIRELIPNCPFRLLSSFQTFLFQLFPRCYLPVRAGPIPA